MSTHSAVNAIELTEAAAKHMRDRAATYDKPEGERSMKQTVEIFNLFHKTTLTETQGWHLMEILKQVRFFTARGYHGDSAEDSIAYGALRAEAHAREVLAAEALRPRAEDNTPPSLDEYRFDFGDEEKWLCNIWCKWYGGSDKGPPLPAKAKVRVKLRDGTVTPVELGLPGRNYPWQHAFSDLDIVEYMIVPPTKP